MRVGIFCHKFTPHVGGLVTYAERLTDYLHDQGHHVDVFTTRLRPDTPSHEILRPGLIVHRYSTRLAQHLPFLFMPKLLLSIGQSTFRAIDVVHSVGYYFFPTVFASAVSSLFGIPHVLTPVFTRNPETWQRRLYDTVLGRHVVRDSTRLVVQSDRELDLLGQFDFQLPSNHVIPFGVDSARFGHDPDPTALKRRLGINDERVVLFVGKIMATKGAFVTLDALRRVLDSGMRVRLVMVGDIHNRQKEAFYRHLHAARLEPHVNLTGPIAHEDGLATYYQLADAVVFPSQYEQFGIVAIEAAASGRPLLGTPVGVMQDLIPRYELGLLHSFDDVEQFAANLREVLTNRRYGARARVNRRHILREYDWHTILERTEAVYNDVVRVPAGL